MDQFSEEIKKLDNNLPPGKDVLLQLLPAQPVSRQLAAGQTNLYFTTGSLLLVC